MQLRLFCIGISYPLQRASSSDVAYVQWEGEPIRPLRRACIIAYCFLGGWEAPSYSCAMDLEEGDPW
jgi:hypothetical protein